MLRLRHKASSHKPKAKGTLPTASGLERFSLGCSSDCFPARPEPFASAHSESFDKAQDKLRRVTPKSKNGQDKLRRESGQLVSAVLRPGNAHAARGAVDVLGRLICVPPETPRAPIKNAAWGKRVNS